MRAAVWVLAAAVAACGTNSPLVPPPVESAPRATEPVTISVVGTNDVHGHVEQLPLLAGYVANLRAARADDGGVVLVDAGDIFQGTLESNLGEGDVMIEAFAEMGYAAAAVGNHEFDFGPAGERPIPEQPGDDPRGALKLRASEAPFPLVTANIRDVGTGVRIDWPNVLASTVVEVRGVRVGIVGASTMSTPRTTMPANFVGLEMMPIADAIAAEAERLRAAGAAVVVVTAHAGGRCTDFGDPTDLSTCGLDDEIFQVARTLPKGAVDVIVAGHSHAGIAHVANDIAVIESFKNGRAFGRVDLVVDGGRVVSTRVFPPQPVCAGTEAGSAPPPDCRGGEYEGAPVAANPTVAAIAARAEARAQAVRDTELGIELAATFEAAYRTESAVGNLFADLMLAAEPSADVALTNGGGLRANLPAGALTYGALYEAAPFDNGFAFVTMSGAQLGQLVAANLRGRHGIFSLAGVRARATCDGSDIRVALSRPDGTPIAPDASLRVATSDFLASGGDGAIGQLDLPDHAIVIPGGPTIRDAMADVMRKRGGTLSPADYIDPARPRITYPQRPMSCE